MNIDLQKHGFDHLTLRIWPEVTTAAVEDVLNHIEHGNIELESDDVLFAGVGTFSKSAASYGVSLAIPKRDDSPILIIRYASLPREGTTRGHLTRRFRQLKEIIGRLSASCTVIGDTHCDLEKGWKPIVSLPLVTFNVPNAFDQIRGVRLAKMVDGEETESTVVDIDEKGTVGMNLRVLHKTVLSLDTPARTLSLLSTLRSKVTVRSEEEEQ